MRIFALAAPLALLGMAGCSAGPDTYASMTTGGVGFGDYQRYLHQRTAAPASGTVPYSVPPENRQAPILPPASMPASAPTTLDIVPMRERPAPPAAPAPGAIATQTLAPLGNLVTASVESAPAAAPARAPVVVASAAPATATPAPTAAIRDQQVYHAGQSQRTTPEGAAPAQAQIVTASIPAPSEHGGPNLVAYALSSQNPVGTEIYRRINPLRWSRWENACLQYRNQDAAQQAFLEAGGPQRDRDNLDPDGDGYACWWDPTPLRQALASN